MLEITYMNIIMLCAGFFFLGGGVAVAERRRVIRRLKNSADFTEREYLHAIKSFSDLSKRHSEVCERHRRLLSRYTNELSDIEERYVRVVDKNTELNKKLRESK